MGRIVLNKVESQLVLVSAAQQQQAIAAAQQAFQGNVAPVIEDRIAAGAIPDGAQVNVEAIEKGKDKGKVALVWPDAPAPPKSPRKATR